MRSIQLARQAARDALTRLPPFEPVANVTYQSIGRLLIIGGASRREQALDALAVASDAANSPPLSITVFQEVAESPFQRAGISVLNASRWSLSGYLGAFALQFETAVGISQTATFDLVLDLNPAPYFRMPQPPQGYFHAGNSEALAQVLDALPQMVGEFEKPKFFAYKASICAHSRSRKVGCRQCIDICSTAAIASEGDQIKVDPHLCMGCGACATVCPSGALTYQYPRVTDRGAQLRAALRAWRDSMGATDLGRAAVAPIFLFHDERGGRKRLDELTTQGRMSDRAVPLEAWHVASIGLDLLLGAIGYGAAGVAILAGGDETAEYRKAVEREMRLAETLLEAIGFAHRRFVWISPGDDVASLLAAMPEQAAVEKVATFHLGQDKRATVEQSLAHLLQQATVAGTKPPDVAALPAASPFGRVQVNRQTCTLCLACAGACPASALMDGTDVPLLKFIERNCVQCGLCQQTCPENAITLEPRFLFGDQRRQEVILNETQPFHCIRCAKIMGTQLMVSTMLARLAGHSMFSGEGALNRLKMCADCRVVDMMSNASEDKVNIPGQDP